MAVTETTAVTDGSLTAVTIAEIETDCRPTDNDSRSKQNMRSRTRPPTIVGIVRVPRMADDRARQAVRRERRMESSAIE